MEILREEGSFGKGQRKEKMWHGYPTGRGKVFQPVIETGVLNPRPKLLRFHMPGPATCP
jgi:hypothetical protein